MIYFIYCDRILLDVVNITKLGNDYATRHLLLCTRLNLLRSINPHRQIEISTPLASAFRTIEDMYPYN